jgi:class 3 adenylate cyclase/tetratricopeptide (TPR) repeat protein
VERKLATVLFVDLVGSTASLAGRDPEVVRRRVNAFFEQVSHCIATHGGIVEKFAGDAVMAAFGIPQAHEDDAERAVRAALAIMDSVHGLGLEARIGVETGEVVADERDSTFATGEAVNVAARLQQAAQPGEILIGPFAYRLTVGAVESEEVGPLDLKGFGEPLLAWRLLGIREHDGRAPSVAASFVGREFELELLENTLHRVIRNKRAHLVTIFGEPGVGKSRLAREFLEGVEGASILVGRSLPYGEGVTYWPLGEMVKVAAGIADDDPVQEAVAKLRSCCGDDAVADLLALAVGVLEGIETERSQQEIAWAAREWAAELADAQPLILLFEDVHWAEEPLLELIEHLAERVKDAPLMIVCLARPELLDIRPGWGGGSLRATAIELEPLAPAESEELLDALLADRELSTAERRTLLEKTEGNPLFVEETIRALAEQEGRGADRIPDTLQALIAARVDRLPPEQRAVLQRASVVGRIFWPGAIEHLASDLESPSGALEGLLLRDFVVRENRSSISGEPAFKFKHVLIREVAYGGLAKSARAEYHAGFAKWLGERTGEELLEIRAFHLDQAARLHEELDGRPPAELAEQAATALTKAGDRALSRESFRTARKLFLRAVELGPTLDRRYSAARAAWRLGDVVALAIEMEHVREAAAGIEPKLEGRALTALADVALIQDADAAKARELVERALDVLQPGDPARFDALWTRSQIAVWLGDAGGFERSAKEALTVARESGRKDFEAMIVQSLSNSYLLRLELEPAEPLVDRALELAHESGSVVGRAAAHHALAWLEHTRGRWAEAEAAYTTARDLYAEIGLVGQEASMTLHLGRLYTMQEDLEQAEKLLRDAVRTFKGLRDRAHLCEAQRSLSQLLAGQGRLEEAERLALEARESVGDEDRMSLSTTKLALGVVRAAQGRHEEAEPLLREAVDGLEAFQMYSPEREALRVLAGFLRDRGRDDEAAAYEERLVELLARSAAPIA